MRYKIVRWWLLLILFSSYLMLGGCKKTPPPQNVKNKQFVEMFGSWSNGGGCHLNITEINGQLFLRDFVAKNIHLNETQLMAKKEGVMISFSAKEQAVLIRGSLSDGNMIVENYCSDLLHKTNNL